VKGGRASGGTHPDGHRATSSTLLDAKARDLPTLVRASPHYYNSDEEIAWALEAIRHCAPSGSR